MKQKQTSRRAGSSLTQPQQKNTAFTLLELVVVIAIIIVLIGLLTIGLIGARGQAANRATKARIAQLEMGAQSFYDAFSVYPPDEWGNKGSPAAGTMMEFLMNHGYDTDDDSDLNPEITISPDNTHQDIECLVYAVTVVRPFLDLKKAAKSNKEATPDEIDWQDADTMDSPAYEICDAWGNPLHYNSSSPHDENEGFVDIWSSGPDADSSATGSGSPEDADNITNWERD